MKTILITGAKGFIGSNLYPLIEEKYKEFNIIKVNKEDYDLTCESEVKQMISKIKPHIVIHLAGKVGGILANKENPVDFFNDNILINTFMFKYCNQYKVEKLITFMGGCSYPANTKSPINELEMWNGYPQEESAAYSISKKMLLVMSKYYRKQFNLNSIVLIPGNIYGEYDNFDLRNSHVIPALIRKFYEAKVENSKSVILWGNGEPIRDFVYIKDVVKTIPFFIDTYNDSEPINISSGKGISIKELCNKIKEMMEYEGDIIWDSSKPNGQLIKIFDISKLNSLNIYCDTDIEDGLDNTIKWYKKHSNKIIW
jgi:GDP-L-fucose synthase